MIVDGSAGGGESVGILIVDTIDDHSLALDIALDLIVDLKDSVVGFGNLLESHLRACRVGSEHHAAFRAIGLLRNELRKDLEILANLRLLIDGAGIEEHLIITDSIGLHRIHGTGLFIVLTVFLHQIGFEVGSLIYA